MFRRPRFPLRITLLLWLVLIITALNAVRLATALAWQKTLSSYLAFPSVAYVAITGGVWVAVGIFLLWSFLRRSPGTRTAFLAGAGGYAAWAWADRIFIQAGPQSNWLFALLATIVLLGFTAIVVLDRHNQSYFRKETYERQPEKSSST